MTVETKATTPEPAESKKIIPLVLESEEETTEKILLSIENGIAKLIKGLTKKNTKFDKYRDCLEALGLGNITEEEILHLPSSSTGILVYYFLEGIKRDFNITFDDTPVSTKGRSGKANNIAERSRIINKKQKQDIIDQTTMEFYKNDIENGILTMPEVFTKIQKAYELKTHLEDCGLIFSPKSTSGILYKGINYEEVGVKKNGGKTIAEIHDKVESKLIIEETKERVAELVRSGIIQLPKQEKITNL